MASVGKNNKKQKSALMGKKAVYHGTTTGYGLPSTIPYPRTATGIAVQVFHDSHGLLPSLLSAKRRSR